MKLNSRKGFTLIEVLLVLAMIALLTTLAIPKLIGIYEEAEKAKAKADAQIIVAAILREELRYELEGVIEKDKWDFGIKGDNNLEGGIEITGEILDKLKIALTPKNYKFYYVEAGEQRRILIKKEGTDVMIDSVPIDN